MKIRAYFSTVSFIFLVVAIAHFIRAIKATPVLIGHFSVPVWASWVAVIVALYLAYQAWKLRP